jgi:hypothetical protein
MSTIDGQSASRDIEETTMSSHTSGFDMQSRLSKVNEQDIPGTLS